MTALAANAAGWAATAAVTVLGFALLVVIHELGHFAVARLCGMRVERFSVGYGPVLWSRRRGDTEWALSALPFGGYVRIAGMSPEDEEDPADPTSYSNQAAWRRFLVILTGPAMNYLLAVLLAAALIATFGFRAPDPTSTVGEVVPDSPAAAAGLRPGDRVLAVEGQPVERWGELVAAVQARPGREVALSVRRADGGEASVRARPKDVDGRGWLGVGPAVEVVRAAPGPALVAGFTRTNQKAAEILSGLGQMLSRKQKAELRGPVGIVQEMARSAQAGVAPFLAMVWFISVVLALFNLLPIPALDGGRLVFLAWEMVTRRRVSPRVENLVHLAGFLALLALMLAVTVFSDLGRLFRR